jgi:hypothetical protein
MTEKDSKRETATAASAVEKRTPEEWAGPCGQRRPRRFEDTFSKVNGVPFDSIGEFRDMHEAATVIHGWKLHEHHEQKTFELTRSDYEAALKAAGETDAKGQPIPHAPAMSPHAAPQFIAAAKGGK